MSDTIHQNQDNSGDPSNALAIPTKHEVPGLPPHTPRQTDIDPAAARRAERQVAGMFLASALMTVLFIVAFLLIPATATVTVPFFTHSVNASNAALGITFGLAIFLIGAGAIQWAKKLMPDQEVIGYRHVMKSDAETREEAGEVFWEGAEASGFAQRKIIRRSLILALAVFPLPLVFLLRDLRVGPLAPVIDAMRTTMWEEGSHVVVEPTGKRIKPEDVPIGGMVSAMPEELWAISPAGERLEGDRTEQAEELEAEDAHFLDELAKAAIILVRMAPEEIVSQQGEGWDYEGILAYSKICTHVGCPIALYQQRTHHLLCPCHQSTFDLSDSGNVVFGPAARALPQLPITVDDEGYIIASAGFDQPVGPSFWERER
jgi:ubiquinol-cytochrome c reductase iron-sulfur subunit